MTFADIALIEKYLFEFSASELGVLGFSWLENIHIGKYYFGE